MASSQTSEVQMWNAGRNTQLKTSEATTIETLPPGQQRRGLIKGLRIYAAAVLVRPLAVPAIPGSDKH